MSLWDCVWKAPCPAPPLLFRVTLVFDLITHSILLNIYWRLMDSLPTAFFAVFFVFAALVLQVSALLRSVRPGPEKYTAAELYALCRRNVQFFHCFVAVLLAVRIALGEGPRKLLEFRGVLLASWLLFQLTINFIWSYAFEQAVDTLIRTQDAQPVPAEPVDVPEQEVWGD